MTKSINTYGYLFSAASSTLKKGSTAEEGSFYQFMSSLVFSAFTIEAYLNHMGQQLFECWNDLESIKPMAKLNLIANDIGIEIDKGKRPYQSLTQLFKFRNEMAHGKTKFLSTNMTKDEPWWVDYCTKKQAAEAKHDIARIITELNTASGVEDLWAFNHESY